MAMQGGAGEHSYARNSNFQASLFQTCAASIISESILENPAAFAGAGLITIADIGCSSGPNTLASVDFVIKQFTELQRRGQATNESVFQVLFSDLETNDFNTLFKLLAQRRATQGNPYFYSAVPGSFTTRLFPTSSVHFSMSNFALHILSKEPAIKNPGRVFVDSTSSPSIIEAYAAQAHEDLSSFLKHRAEEIIPGGILSCSFLGKTNSDDRSFPWFDFFQAAWHELVSERLITQESLDDFNLCAYNRTVADVQKVLEKFDCFKTIRLERTQVKPPDARDKSYLVRLSKGCQAVTRSSVLKHFKGDVSLTELLYQKTDQKIEASDSSISGYQAQNHITVITVVLLRI